MFKMFVENTWETNLNKLIMAKTLLFQFLLYYLFEIVFIVVVFYFLLTNTDD